ncbi:MAG TPA: NAD(P)/FAD-dependent oxidoreductase [Spirochaetota bacterium]|nr:NAD(P)/FAD-dependent oxidoreductase [Spirochaetota bacterium]
MAKKQANFDVIISGAGPAGLSAGILCARSGMSVLVCEKAAKPGPLPRAETVYDNPLFDRLIRPGFMKSIGLYETNGRRFNSPGARKVLDLRLTNGRKSIIFEWADLIGGLYGSAKKAGVAFKFRTEVAAPVMEGGACRGVELASGKKLFARTVLACDGHSSRLGRLAGIPYEKMNSPIIKNIVSNFRSDYDGFEYFFIGAGELPYARELPPLVVFVFPRGDGRCETGLYIPAGPAIRAGIIPDNLDRNRLLDTWQSMKKSYPRFSDIMKGTRDDLLAVMGIPAGRLHGTPAMVPGLLFLGDTIGFLEASGVSGVITSMQNALFASEFLQRNRGSAWDAALAEKYNLEFRTHPVFWHVKKRYAATALFNRIVFSGFRTAEHINRHWWFVRLAYKFK